MTVKTAEGRDRSKLATVIQGRGGGGLIATEKKNVVISKKMMTF